MLDTYIMTATFERRVHGGIIELPKGCRHLFEGEVTAALYKEETPLPTRGDSPSLSRMLALIHSPAKVTGFEPISREEANERQR